MAHQKNVFLILGYTFLAFALLSGCYRIRSSNGGGEIKNIPTERALDVNDVALPEGYKIEIVASGLNYPTGIAFDEEGAAYVTESGYSYGEDWETPTLKKILPDGSTTTIATGGENGPWNGLTFYEGDFYISEGGQMEGGKILKVDASGEISAIVTDLPSLGDHHTNGPLVRDGYLYFGQGTATNAGIVGKDNKDYGWLERFPQFHDVPCEDVTLAGYNVVTENVLNASAAEATTGAYVPFGVSTKKGQVIKGSIPCSGAIMRVPVDGGEIELVAWGFRNPYGLAFSPRGELFITDNGYDDRGSRPVWGVGDVLWRVEAGSWYGWPDFSAGKFIVGGSYDAPGKDDLRKILQDYPGAPPDPAAILGVHSSSNGFDFSHNGRFGHEGEAFVAQFGDMAPEVGKVLSPVGFKVVRVNTTSGIVSDFAVNKGKRNGPATWLKGGGLERPVAARFDPTGSALYVVDFGILKMTKKGAEPVKNTGVVWKITRK